jgi:hypothetical protein
MNRRIDALRKDLTEKIQELMNARFPLWKRVEFGNSIVHRGTFYAAADMILLETLCDWLDGLDGIIPIRIAY